MQWEARERAIAQRGRQMSAADRPTAHRQETGHPALAEANTSIPVTPSVSHEDNQAYFPPSRRAYGISKDAPPHILEAVGADGARETSTSANADGRRTSLSAAAAGVPDGEDLLRRLSLTGQQSTQDVADLDPQAAHPSLNLSGNVISAAFCVPYKIGYTSTGEWVRFTGYS